ncbi:MAG: hypothetical protein GJU76_11220 [Gallionella sp.]|jgi:DNA-binding beta-propeller fold protein YncE|nr:hypothetical protein [Gallionella sp.]
MKRTVLMGLVGTLYAMFCAAAGAAVTPPLRLVHKYSLPLMVKGHFDHFAVDPAGQRLFGTAVDSHLLVIFNLGTGKVIRLIPMAIPRGVVYRASLKRFYVSDGSGSLRIFDSRTYALLKELPVEVDADPIIYDPDTRRIFVVNGGAKAGHDYSYITAFDSVSDRQIGNIKLPGSDIEDLAVETDGTRLFANVQALNQVDVIDARTLRLEKIWHLTRAKVNMGAALDAKNHRLFVACRQGGLLVIDSDTGEELKSLPIGKMTDYVAFDRASRRIYVSGGGGHGWVDVYQEQGAEHYRLLQHVVTEPGAATSLLVASLGEYVVMVPSAPQRPAQVWVYQIAPEARI